MLDAAHAVNANANQEQEVTEQDNIVGDVHGFIPGFKG